MSQSVCERWIALVREQIVKTWRLRQDTVLEKSFGQLLSTWLQRFESGSDERHRIVVVLENDPHRSTLQRLQRLRLCSGETGVPHRTGVLQYCPNHRDVEVQQVITLGAWSFQLLAEMQSRCRLRHDGVDMLCKTVRRKETVIRIKVKTIEKHQDRITHNMFCAVFMVLLYKENAFVLRPTCTNFYKKMNAKGLR